MTSSIERFAFSFTRLLLAHPSQRDSGANQSLPCRRHRCFRRARKHAPAKLLRKVSARPGHPGPKVVSRKTAKYSPTAKRAADRQFRVAGRREWGQLRLAAIRDDERRELCIVHFTTLTLMKMQTLLESWRHVDSHVCM